MRQLRFAIGMLGFLYLSGCTTDTTKQTLPSIDLTKVVSEAVDNPSRSEEDRARDTDRNPQAVLSFSGVKPTDKVLDIAAGGGYYTTILAEVVGPNGWVYAINPTIVAEKYPEAVAPLESAVKQGLLPNVSYQLLPDFSSGLPSDLDMAINILFYHDFVWLEKNRQATNKAVFDALKPGGIYLIVDHSSTETGWEAATTLHRGNASLTKKELTAVGFEYLGESNALRHPDDPLTANVFSDIRGKTDRFIYKFQKPLQ